MDMWDARREAWQARDQDARDVGDVDYGRVIHSASFRRLQGKTQILNLGDSDFYRTRLTHSLEVAQIAGGLVSQLAQSFPTHAARTTLPTRSMIHAIASAHDLGHPPFGHGGEVALNWSMRDSGGFEGNGQTLRILARLESFSMSAGANLSRRVMLGVLKYPASYLRLSNPQVLPRLAEGLAVLKTIDVAASTPPKCYLDSEMDVVDWILSPLSADDRDAFTAVEARAGRHSRTIHKSLDCSIMDLADDIAYGVHDLEDAIALRLVTPEAFREAVQPEHCAAFLDSTRESGENNDPYEAMIAGFFGGAVSRKQWIGRVVGHFITGTRYHEAPQFAEPLLRWRAGLSPDHARFLTALKDLVMAEVIRSPAVQHFEFKGQSMVIALFEALQSDPDRLLPAEARGADDDPRRVCDFVAGMTDAGLLKTYERLFAPRMGSVFDRL